MGTLDTIRTLCTKNGTSLKALEKELGFSNGSLAKSATIKSERLQKIAEYFNVSVDYLMTGTEPKEKPVTELTKRDHRDIKKSVDEIMTSLDKNNGETLYYDGVEVHLSDETKALLRNALTLTMQAVKLENKEKYNPHKNGK